jgi:hypothetical protein
MDLGSKNPEGWATATLMISAIAILVFIIIMSAQLSSH